MTETNKQYFYQFSQGSYSDYGVGGLFVCDHEIPESDWDNHYKIFSDECTRLAKLIPTEVGNSYRRIVDSSEMKTYKEFRDKTPEEAFQSIHNMIAVECTEFWRD